MDEFKKENCLKEGCLDCSVKELKCNIKDLSEKGETYEVRFFQKVSDYKEDEETPEKIEEEPPKKIQHREKPTIKIDPKNTTKIIYYEPEKKKSRSWFRRYFMCCA
ncbi:hypothetical protein NGRA_2498 [Nosema granulosis]|uniref:Uncharacterized protein n=1 Tax=Nosema granulosis TaxID=83296 RepID=A0A9P6KYD5_9MICR|nr:hypothetical protein NGRA_2498 [Nosema granulosis]